MKQCYLCWWYKLSLWQYRISLYKQVWCDKANNACSKETCITCADIICRLDFVLLSVLCWPLGFKNFPQMFPPLPWGPGLSGNTTHRVKNIFTLCQYNLLVYTLTNSSLLDMSSGCFYFHLVPIAYSVPCKVACFDTTVAYGGKTFSFSPCTDSCFWP